jgi:hypothetical protein
VDYSCRTNSVAKIDGASSSQPHTAAGTAASVSQTSNVVARMACVSRRPHGAQDPCAQLASELALLGSASASVQLRGLSASVARLPAGMKVAGA